MRRKTKLILILKLIRWLLRPVVRLYGWAEDKIYFKENTIDETFFEVCGECGDKLDDWGDCKNCN
jgi:hypothetical protein